MPGDSNPSLKYLAPYIPETWIEVNKEPVKETMLFGNP
jgi:hypothetical protein